MKIKQLTCALLLTFGLAANAANQVNTVYQVTDSVAVSEDVDYIIAHTTPFVGEGKVNITNTEHAVVIFQGIRPSLVIKNHLKGRVFINGEQAVNGANCQVKMYAHGAIVMPYAKDIKPLTVYSEPKFGGTAVNDFGLENSGGFMNSLSEEKLNNQIRSFKLKRGYMVTFATGKSGWGYSRCFIADKEDLELPELPVSLDGRISSYRVFQWYDAEKKGLASDTRMSANDLLASSWCYTWGVGSDMRPDHECIPHRIHEGWPNPADCGKANFSCHMKTNNEPGNSADDTPNTVEEILNNWQTLMRTGMRLCSESSHDGSWAHLDKFIAEIDKRGWRCDILDLHCYWASGFDNMKSYYDKYGKRPIWISEFVWGASWNNNGIFNTDRSFSQANQQKNLDAMKGIFASLNNSPYVERYAYWNSEADCSKLLRGENELSLTGKYFQTMQSGMAYRKEYEKVPNVVYTAPSNLAGTWASQTDGAFKLSWSDTNGDMLSEIKIQRKPEGDGASAYKTVATLSPKDISGKSINYNYTDTLPAPGVYEYRVINVAPTGKDFYSANSVKAAKSTVLGADKVEYGELVMLNASEMQLNFTQAFDDVPAVFMGTLTSNNSKLQLGNLISTVGRTNFTYSPVVWTTSSSSAFEKSEAIPFMALMEGNYKFSDMDSEVGATKVSMKDTTEVVFAQAFPEGVVPVVLTEIRKPIVKKSAMMVKVFDVTNVGFKCIVMIEDESPVTTTSYNVCYMAVTPGVGVVDEAKGVMIAAGRNVETIYGATARNNYFTFGDDTLRFVNPYIFTNLQTNAYDAAAMVRKQGNGTTVTEGDMEYVVGARFKRIVDSSRKTASDGTKLAATTMKDDLGWVVLYTRAEGTSEPTSIEQITHEAAYVRPYVVDGVIRVDGCDNFEVYSTSGVKLNARQPQLPGVYVVRTATAAAMVVVK